MAALKELVFIINPISGTGSKRNLPEVIQKYLGELPGVTTTIVYTEYAGHARVIAKEAADRGVYACVAVGGDGTVNEVGSSLLGTETALGIIPFGSGNGLVRHLGIPLNKEKAVAMLATAKTVSMDVGFLDGKPFFCTAGLGFDAYVAHLFDKAKGRGLHTYVTTALQGLQNFRPETFELEMNGETRQQEAFILTLANASQYGNNVKIAPDASVHDGKLDMCILAPFAAWKAPVLAAQLFNGGIMNDDDVQIHPFKEAKITRAGAGLGHIDGEPIQLPASVDVHVKAGLLKVLVVG